MDKTIKKILLVLFFAGLVVLFLRPAFLKVQFGGISISITSVKNLSIIVGFIWLFLFAVRKPHFARRTVIDIEILLLLVWFSICFIFGTEHHGSSLLVLIVYTLFYFAASEIFSNIKNIKILYNVLFFSSAVVSAGNLFFHAQKGFSTIVEAYPFWPGKQAISLFLVFSLVLIFAVTMVNWNTAKAKVKMLWLSAVCLQFICLIFTFSRGAWLSLLFSLCIAVFINIKKNAGSAKTVSLNTVNIWKYLSAGILLIIVLLIFLPGSIKERACSIFSLNDENIKQRVSIWKTSIRLIGNHPVTGIGPGNFGKVHLEQYRDKNDNFSWWGTNYHAHNLYLQVAAESGITGILFFAFVVLKIIIHGYKFIFNEDNGFITGMRIGTFSAFLGFLFWSLAESSYTGGFSPLSFFHLNLVIILFVNIMLFDPKSLLK